MNVQLLGVMPAAAEQAFRSTSGDTARVEQVTASSASIAGAAIEDFEIGVDSALRSLLRTIKALTCEIATGIRENHLVEISIEVARRYSNPLVPRRLEAFNNGVVPAI